MAGSHKIHGEPAQYPSMLGCGGSVRLKVVTFDSDREDRGDRPREYVDTRCPNVLTRQE
jgi:hypothetical protein